MSPTDPGDHPLRIKPEIYNGPSHRGGMAVAYRGGRTGTGLDALLSPPAATRQCRPRPGSGRSYDRDRSLHHLHPERRLSAAERVDCRVYLRVPLSASPGAQERNEVRARAQDGPAGLGRHEDLGLHGGAETRPSQGPWGRVAVAPCPTLLRRPRTEQ